MSKLLIFNDTSGSTNGNIEYFKLLLKYFNDVKLKYVAIQIFTWNSISLKITLEEFMILCEKCTGNGGTIPSCIISKLPEDPENYDIIFITDGQTTSEDAKSFNTQLIDKYGIKRFNEVKTIIIFTGGKIDLTCVLALQRFGKEVSHIVYEKNDQKEPMIINGSIPNINSLIESISSVPEFYVNSEKLLELITLFFQGLVNGDESIKESLIQLKKKLTLYITRDNKKYDEQISGIQKDYLDRKINYIQFSDELSRTVHDIMLHHFSNICDWSKIIDKMIQIVSGSAVGVFALHTNNTGLITGTKFDNSQVISCDIPGEITDGLTQKQLDELPECSIMLAHSLSCLPLSSEKLFGNDQNIAVIGSNPLNAIHIISENKDLKIFLPLLGFEFLSVMKHEIHPMTREVFEYFLILPPGSLGDTVMVQAVEYNKKNLQKWMFGKKMGNPTYIFIVVYFLALQSKFEFVKEIIPLMEDQLRFMLLNTPVNASMRGPDPAFPADMMQLSCAISFVLESTLHSPKNNQNPMLAHVPYLNELVHLSEEVMKIPVNEAVKCNIKLHKTLLKIIRIFKKSQGRFNSLKYFIRCFLQKIAFVEQISFGFDFIPLDGIPTPEHQIIVLDELRKLLMCDLSFNEISYLVNLVDDNIDTFVSKSITSKDIIPGDNDSFVIPSNITSWKYKNVPLEDLPVPINETTGKPFFCTEKQKFDKWGVFKHNYILSCAKIFQTLAKKLRKFPSSNELQVEIFNKYILSSRKLTLPSQFIEFCDTTVEDYQKAYGNNFDMFDIACKIIL